MLEGAFLWRRPAQPLKYSALSLLFPHPRPPCHRSCPLQIYNLAAQSHVKVSFDLPEYTADSAGVGALRLFSAIRAVGLEKSCRVYQASTSELFGKVVETPQKETTPFYPRSPYGVAKLFAYWTVSGAVLWNEALIAQLPTAAVFLAHGRDSAWRGSS